MTGYILVVPGAQLKPSHAAKYPSLHSFNICKYHLSIDLKYFINTDITATSFFGQEIGAFSVSVRCNARAHLSGLTCVQYARIRLEFSPRNLDLRHF